MKYPEIVEAEKRDPISIVSWTWVIMWILAGIIIGAMIYFVLK